MSDNELKRAHVGKRLSEYAVYNGVVTSRAVPEVEPEADIRGQTQEVLGHIDRLLAEAGNDKTRILSCQIFLKDVDQIGAMNEVWDAWVAQGQHAPASHRGGALANPTT